MLSSPAADSSNRMHGQPPVIIEPYDPAWPAKFEDECRLITPTLSPWLVAPLEHIGSTAVPGLPAKAVIDIMGAVRDLENSRQAIEALKPLSYCYFPYKADSMHWFCKPSDFERTYHLHLIPIDSGLWHDRLAFRDQLRIDRAAREAYSELKHKLALKFKDDRDAYTNGKAEFIKSVLNRPVS
jgi:GrpB-like predicted nucleotidyltransferase (UPF0157 family)